MPEELFIPGIPDLPLSLVPNSLLGWRSNVSAFLTTHPFDKSVFLMIRYRGRNKSLIAAVKGALKKCGFLGVLASEYDITDDLYNPVACLLCCSRGLALFDQPEPKQKFNPNVAYELGMMHLLGRDCLILKHESLKALHTDVLMKLYKEYSLAEDAAARVQSWLGNGA